MSAPRRHGRLIAVVGPSGVGKDSVLTGLAAQAPELSLVRRVITRAPELGGEDYEPASLAEFEARVAAEDFCLHWDAHGLRYGIPMEVLTRTIAGADHLVNLSRGVLMQARAIFPKLVVINLTASPATLARRLADRGREDAETVAARLARDVPAFDPALDVHHVANDGALGDTIAAALDLLHGRLVVPS